MITHLLLLSLCATAVITRTAADGCPATACETLDAIERKELKLVQAVIQESGAYHMTDSGLFEYTSRVEGVTHTCATMTLFPNGTISVGALAHNKNLGKLFLIQTDGASVSFFYGPDVLNIRYLTEKDRSDQRIVNALKRLEDEGYTLP